MDDADDYAVRKAAAMTAVQTLLLMNAVEKDYLDTVLDAIVDDDVETAAYYMQLVSELERGRTIDSVELSGEAPKPSLN